MNIPLSVNSLLAFLLACAVKATVVWVAAAIVIAFYRRASASSRHFIWASTVVVSLVLPLFALMLPTWRSSALSRATVLLNAVHPVSAAHSVANTSPMLVNASTSGFQFAPWLAAVWFLGVLAIALRFVVGLFRTAALSTQSRPMTDLAWIADLGKTATFLQIHREVRALQSRDPAAMPLTWGVFRPTILLPAGAENWLPERRRMVVSHELAHIARADWLMQVFAELARAIYWFHPLAWKAAAVLRHESERACDDAVLNSGVTPEDYAGELLSIARSFTNSRANICPALAVARPTNLERRFAAMLNPSLHRHTSRRSQILTAVAALCLLLPLAAVRLTAQNTAENFTGTIYDASGAVVPNATVIVHDAKGKLVEMTSSATDGSFNLKSIPAGEYELRVMKAGFEPYRDPQLHLKAGSNAPFVVHLNVGTVSETVDVPAEGHARRTSTKPVTREKVGGDIEASKLVKKVQPIYPESAKSAGIQGKVNLHAIIGMDGAPLSLQVVNTDIDPDLARSSIEAVSHWRYSPTLLNGQPIEVETNITVNYTLNP